MFERFRAKVLGENSEDRSLNFSFAVVILSGSFGGFVCEVG